MEGHKACKSYKTYKYGGRKACKSYKSYKYGGHPAPYGGEPYPTI